jgi:hypothetical protein
LKARKVNEAANKSLIDVGSKNFKAPIQMRIRAKLKRKNKAQYVQQIEKNVSMSSTPHLRILPSILSGRATCSLERAFSRAMG